MADELSKLRNALDGFERDLKTARGSCRAELLRVIGHLRSVLGVRSSRDRPPSGGNPCGSHTSLTGIPYDRYTSSLR